MERLRRLPIGKSRSAGNLEKPDRNFTSYAGKKGLSGEEETPTGRFRGRRESCTPR